MKSAVGPPIEWWLELGYRRTRGRKVSRWVLQGVKNGKGNIITRCPPEDMRGNHHFLSTYNDRVSIRVETTGW